MSEREISRRALLAGASALGASALLSSRLARALAAEDTGKLQIDDGLVVMPARGQLYVASDFHTRHADFQKWLTRTNIVQRLKNEQDTYGLILGDAVDQKANDAQAEKDGDSRIVDKLREIHATLGENGKRLIVIQGNHELEVVRIYEALKTQFGLNPQNRNLLVQALYQSKNGEFFQQFNFLERITDEQCAYLKGWPLAVLAKNGVVAVHASPSSKIKSPKEIAQRQAKVADELVWNRPAELVLENGYTGEDLAAFLKMMEGSGVLISGHTPLGALPPAWVHNGVGVYAEHQLILATSYGSEGGEKSYLVMDLGKKYAAANDLAMGREIQRLEK